MIVGSDWTFEQWESFFEKEQERRVDGTKCHCPGSYYQHIRPKDRIKPLFNWQCMTCRKQFKGT